MKTTFERPAPDPVAAEIRFASRMEGMSPSAIREILKVTERPDILSFAGGLPAPELFPVQEVGAAFAEVLAKDGASALQYSTTEGYAPLRAWIANRLQGRGIAAHADQVLVTNGAQQGIDLLAKVLLEPGDVVVVEDPTYLAALQVFSSYQARPVAVPSDDDGMRVEALERVLVEHRPKLIYIVPDFHNPKGTSLSASRRVELVRLAQKHRVPLIEDDPYGELRFQGDFPRPLASLDDTGLVAYLSTFSKTLAPGLRIGWMHAGPELLRAATVAKQAADLQTATLAQRATSVLLRDFDFEGHLAVLRRTYGARCQCMLQALARCMPPGTTWTRPEGGLFLWVKLPPGVEDQALFARAVEEKVAFVPGSPFFVASGNNGFMRLNYSNRPEALIEEGMRRLGRAVHELVRSRDPAALSA